MLLASDGVWDFLSVDEVSDLEPWQSLATRRFITRTIYIYIVLYIYIYILYSVIYI